MLFFFFFNDTATTEIYTLSLHDALPISLRLELGKMLDRYDEARRLETQSLRHGILNDQSRGLKDRKSTRLNSSHLVISYAVFCLKKKNGRLTPVRSPHRPPR